MNALLLTCLLVTALQPRALEQADGAAYLKLRAQWIEQLRTSPARQVELEAALAATPWQQAIVAESALVAARRPELAQAFSDLRGIDPADYSRRRRPEPEVARELRRRQIPGAVLMAFYRKELALSGLSDAERIALRDAILLAVGRSSHPLAFAFLAQAASVGDATERHLALHALAQTGDARVATMLRGYTAGDPEARASAVSAAAQLRTPEGLQILLDAAAAAPRPVANALGLFAAPSAWRSAPSSPLRQRAALSLVSLLASVRTEADAEAIVQSLATARHPATAQPLQRLAEDKAMAPLAREAAERALRLLALRR